MRLHYFWILASIMALPPAFGKEFHIQSSRSRLDVKTDTSGLLGGLGHQHLIRARNFGGKIVEKDGAFTDASLWVETKTLNVLDKGASEEDRKEIFDTLQGKDCLHTEKFEKIEFKSSFIEVQGENATIVGDLKIKDVERTVQIVAKVSSEKNTLKTTGKFVVKQTDFGIEPYSTALGMVSVEDEITFDFEIVAQQSGK